MDALAQGANTDIVRTIHAALEGVEHIYFAGAPLSLRRSRSAISARVLLQHLHRANQALLADLLADFAQMAGYLAGELDIAVYDERFAGSFLKFRQRVGNGELNKDAVVNDLLQQGLEKDALDDALRSYFRRQKKLQQQIFDPSGAFYRMHSALCLDLQYLQFVLKFSRHVLERQHLFHQLVADRVVLQDPQDPAALQALRQSARYRCLSGPVDDFLKSTCFTAQDEPWDTRDAHAWASHSADDSRRLYPWRAHEADWRDGKRSGKFFSWPLPMKLNDLEQLSDYGAAYLNQAGFADWLEAHAAWLAELLAFVAEDGERRERDVGGYAPLPQDRMQAVQAFIAALRGYHRNVQTIAALLASLIVVPDVQRCSHCYRRTAETPKGARQLLICAVHKAIDTHAPKAQGQVSEKTRLRQAQAIASDYRQQLAALQAQLQHKLATPAGQQVYAWLCDLEADAYVLPLAVRCSALAGAVRQLGRMLGAASAARLQLLAQWIAAHAQAVEETLAAHATQRPTRSSTGRARTAWAAKQERLEGHADFWSSMLLRPSFFRLYFSGVADLGYPVPTAFEALKQPVDSRHVSQHWLVDAPRHIPSWVYLDYKTRVATLLPDLLAHEAWVQCQGAAADARLHTAGHSLRPPKARQLHAYQARIVALRHTQVPTPSGPKAMSFARIAAHIYTESGGEVQVSKAAVQQEYVRACAPLIRQQAKAKAKPQDPKK